MCVDGVKKNQMDFHHFSLLLKQGRFEEAIECVTTENANDSQYSTGRGALELFVLYGPDGPNGVAMLHRLLSKGVKLNHVAPLYYAATRKKVGLVRALLDLRAPIGCDAIDWAVFRTGFGTGFEEDRRNLSHICAKMLIDAGAKCTVRIPFYESRLLARKAAIAILSLQTQKLGGGAKDVLRIIGRCVWGTRGHNGWDMLQLQLYQPRKKPKWSAVKFLKKNWVPVACVSMILVFFLSNK